LTVLFAGRMAEDKEDVEEKLDPTIRYLQKLGPDHLDLIFEGSRWVFSVDWERALVVSGVVIRSRVGFQRVVANT
jgi:hypothetical protein